RPALPPFPTRRSSDLAVARAGYVDELFAGAARRQRQSAVQPQPRQPLSRDEPRSQINGPAYGRSSERKYAARTRRQESMPYTARSEEHTSELQSRSDL